MTHGKQLHVVMFPWLAYGHFLPFLELSQRLANHGIKISFVSTPRNIANITKMGIAKQMEIDMVELPLGAVEGLPAGAETTADIPYHMEDLLLTAFDGLEKPFERLLQRISPHYVIFDFMQNWAPTVAAKLGIPGVLFVVTSAAVAAYEFVPTKGTINITAGLKMAPPGFPSSLIAWRPFELRGVLETKHNNSKGEITVLERVQKSIESCALVAIKTCFEIEGKFMEYLEEAIAKPVLPIGPLLSHLPDDGYKESYCLRWLDSQAPSSVIFAAFGSQVFLSEEQIGALARGMEATGMPFLWVLRFPRYALADGMDERSMATKMLPEDFEGGVQKRGLIHVGWAPQLQILSHPSVGVFLCHSGFGSVLEAVRCGVKSVLLPMVTDQGLNARLYSNELRVGIEVERDDNGNFTEKDILNAVRKVTNDKEGNEITFAVKEVRDKVFASDACDERNSREFVQLLQKGITNFAAAREPQPEAPVKYGINNCSAAQELSL